MSQYKKLDIPKAGLMKYKVTPQVLKDAESQGLKAGYIDPLMGGLMKSLFMKAPVAGVKKVSRRPKAVKMVI